MGSVTRRVCSDLSCLGMHLNLAQIRVMVNKLPILRPLTAIWNDTNTIQTVLVFTVLYVVGILS